MQDLIGKLLGEHTPGWISKLTDAHGFDTSQAKSFVPAVIHKITGLFSRGSLDLSNLDAASILNKLNPGDLASETGVDEEKAYSGLIAIVPDMFETAKGALGSDGVMDRLGDARGLLGGFGQ